MGVCTPKKYIVSYSEDVSNLELRDYYHLEMYFNEYNYPYVSGDSFLNFIIHYPIDISQYLDANISQGICIYRNKSQSFHISDFSYHDQAVVGINIFLWLMLFSTLYIGIRRLLKNIRRKK